MLKRRHGAASARLQRVQNGWQQRMRGVSQARLWLQARCEGIVQHAPALGIEEDVATMLRACENCACLSLGSA